MYKSERHRMDGADCAMEFLEQEVGRYDWQTNWTKFKANHAGILVKRVQAWLDHLGIDHDPNEIIKFLDEMVASKSGKWK